MVGGMSTLELAALIAGYALAVARLLNAGKLLWSWLPTKLQPLLPALVTVLPLLAAQLGAVTTKLDLVESLVLALGALTTAIRGEHPVPPLAIVMLIGGLACASGCAGWKPIARTVDSIAGDLCTQFFAEQKPALSLEDVAEQFCNTREDLKPWIDSVLAAKASAGRAALAGPGGAP